MLLKKEGLCLLWISKCLLSFSEISGCNMEIRQSPIYSMVKTIQVARLVSFYNGGIVVCSPHSIVSKMWEEYNQKQPKHSHIHLPSEQIELQLVQELHVYTYNITPELALGPIQSYKQKGKRTLNRSDKKQQQPKMLLWHLRNQTKLKLKSGMLSGLKQTAMLIRRSSWCFIAFPFIQWKECKQSIKLICTPIQLS